MQHTGSNAIMIGSEPNCWYRGWCVGLDCSASGTGLKHDNSFILVLFSFCFSLYFVASLRVNLGLD